MKQYVKPELVINNLFSDSRVAYDPWDEVHPGDNGTGTGTGNGRISGSGWLDWLED